MAVTSPCCRAISPRSGSISPWISRKSVVLPVPLRPKQTDPLARLNRQIRPIQNRRAAKTKGDVTQCKEGHEASGLGDVREMFDDEAPMAT